MKKTHYLLAALLFAPAVLFAQPKKDRPDTPIEKDMHRMAKAFRQLHKQVADPAKNASSIELVAIIRTNATDARTHIPLRAADIPKPKRPAFVADFRQKMGQFLGVLDRLTAALKAGHNDEAVELVKRMEELQKEDHKKFRKPKKHHGFF